MLAIDWSGGELKAEKTSMREGCSYASMFIYYFLCRCYGYCAVLTYLSVRLEKAGCHSVGRLVLYFMYFVFVFHWFSVFQSLWKFPSCIDGCARVLPTLPVSVVVVVGVSIKEQRIESSWSCFQFMVLNLSIILESHLERFLKPSRPQDIPGAIKWQSLGVEPRHQCFLKLCWWFQ